MKRIMILLLIACSATITTSAQQKKATVDNTPYNVKALFYTFLKSWGAPSDEVYSVQRNPNTNQIESSVKITHFVANVNTGTVRQNMSAIGDAFKKDESRAYQLLHLAPGNKESLALSAVNENGQRTSYLVRGADYEEMWLLCAKNPENPKLRDAYAIKWSMNDDKSKALGTIYQITSLRPDLYEQNMSASIFNDGDTEDIELYQMIFDGVCEGFGIEKDAPIKNKVLKGTFIWHWTAKKIHEADEDKRIDVADKVINMFTGMSAQESERINNAEKTEAQTREQVIHGILDEMYNSNK